MTFQSTLTLISIILVCAFSFLIPSGSLVTFVTTEGSKTFCQRNQQDAANQVPSNDFLVTRDPLLFYTVGNFTLHLAHFLGDFQFKYWPYSQIIEHIVCACHVFQLFQKKPKERKTIVMESTSFYNFIGPFGIQMLFQSFLTKKERYQKH